MLQRRRRDAHWYGSTAAARKSRWRCPSVTTSRSVCCLTAAEQPLPSLDDSGSSDVWVSELARGTLTRLTTEGAANANPLWSTDGRRVAFSSSRDGQPEVFWQAADGSGTAERLLTIDESARRIVPYDWTPDGATLFVQATFPETGRDVGMVSVDGPGTWEPLIQTAGGWRIPRTRQAATKSTCSGSPSLKAGPQSPSVVARALVGRPTAGSGSIFVAREHPLRRCASRLTSTRVNPPAVANRGDTRAAARLAVFRPARRPPAPRCLTGWAAVSRDREYWHGRRRSRKHGDQRRPELAPRAARTGVPTLSHASATPPLGPFRHRQDRRRLHGACVPSATPNWRTEAAASKAKIDKSLAWNLLCRS